MVYVIYRNRAEREYVQCQNHVSFSSQRDTHYSCDEKYHKWKVHVKLKIVAASFEQKKVVKKVGRPIADSALLVRIVTAL